jgi:hypothetical protein
MACLPPTVVTVLKDAGREDIAKSIETSYGDLVEKRVDFVKHGDPEILTDKERTKLNCALLTQVLIHRAERLVVASGQMETKQDARKAGICKMAERVGFEPTVRFPAHTLSKRAP